MSKHCNEQKCDSCNKWLHSDCAAIDPAMVTKDMPFNCGCDIDQSYPYDTTLSILKQGLVGDIVITDQDIMIILRF